MSEQTSKQHKVWKRVGLFDTYEAALSKKNEIISEFPEDMLVKIKRYGQNYTRFQVKYWHPDFVQSTNKKKKENKKK
tara:strand:- start:54 stop:284 length:231 start_codon:yes stop_codon:yes gene_type:complete